MRTRREKILADPRPTGRSRSSGEMPDDFEDLTRKNSSRSSTQLEDEVLSVDPAVLREEIARLTKLDRPGHASSKPVRSRRS